MAAAVGSTWLSQLGKGVGDVDCRFQAVLGRELLGGFHMDFGMVPIMTYVMEREGSSPATEVRAATQQEETTAMTDAARILIQALFMGR